MHFPPELPITARVADIARAIDASPVVIVAGATGSGKTTQLPKIALAMGRGLDKIIGVTQPRRIAATSVAARVASELGTPLGTDVGYHVRFDDRTSPGTYVKFMTDGILLAEIQGDPLLRKYDTIVVDEAHERSLTIDFLLGYLARILPERPDLKVEVSSATLETERFSAFFGGAPVIEVEGRTYPVEVLYEPPEEDADLAEAVASAVAGITSLDPRGDILVFLPGEREIRETEGELLARSFRHTVIQPLYARLSAAEQARVFAPMSQRRIVLATNVAETSITLPGIVYVVDTGVARLSRYEPRSGTTRLQIEGISQASAEQRKGRCGRVREGICVRLYDEASFAARPAFTDPEIKRTGLAGVILRMKSLGLGNVEDFRFLDPPDSRAITEGYRVLEELGAIGPDRELLPVGRKLARFPVDPRIGRMILAGHDLGVLPDVLVVAAALSAQDPRERPRDVQQKADALHKRFRDERSDFVGFLRLWEFVRDAERKGSSYLRRVCKENFLSYLRVREWREVHRQLEETVRELGLSNRVSDAKDGTPRTREPSVSVAAPVPGPARGAAPAPPKTAASGDGKAPAKVADDALHAALLTGLLSKVGQLHPENRVYVGAKQTRFFIHPSSSLAKKPPFWLMAFELVETSQLFARTAAKIEPEWLLSAGAHLLRRSYSDPHWSERSGRAMVKEQATLFGLVVAKERSVEYATVAPAMARLMFIDYALVRGEYKTRGRFQERNRVLLAEVARLRDKARRSDMLADDQALMAFFDRRVPSDVVDGKGFEAFRERAEAVDPDILALDSSDVLIGDEAIRPADYPDVVTLHGTELPVTYLFDPSSDTDGITLSIPLLLLPQLAEGELDWTIPGWHEEKIAAILQGLPKAIRRELGTAGEVAREVAARLEPFRGELVPELRRAIEELRGIDVPEDALRMDTVPTHLRLVCRVVDEHGKTLALSRDAGALLRRFAPTARAAWKSVAAAPLWERTGLTAWDFGDLPEHVVRRSGGSEVRSYPALVDRGTSVDLTLLEASASAEAASLGGVRRLLSIAAKRTISALSPRLPGAFTRPSGAMTSRTRDEAFRSALLLRIVDDAFGLSSSVPVPRTLPSFERVLAAGVPRLAQSALTFSEAVTAAAVELDKTLAALRSASKHTSATLAIGEIRGQLEHLFPETLVRDVPLEMLQQFPRYLRAAQARLGRAIADPRKDLGKLEPIAPLWAAFLAKRGSARDHVLALSLHWDLEELRVAVFAPELRARRAVSVAKVAAALATLH